MVGFALVRFIGKGNPDEDEMGALIQISFKYFQCPLMLDIANVILCLEK